MSGSRSSSPVEVSILPAISADDAELVAEITDLMNRVYSEAEAGLWIEGGATRTTEDEVATLVRAEEIAIARLDGEFVGAVRVQQLDDEMGEFGMLVASPQHRGVGIGRELVNFAEDWARGRGLDRMQLELLVPRSWSHPVKDFLREWYTRIGYRPVRTGVLDEAYPQLVPHLATSCDFVIFHKELNDRRGGTISESGPYAVQEPH